MNRVTLVNTPQPTSPSVDVRDYELTNGKFARVILEVNPVVRNDHFEMTAQAYEINADGHLVAAPNGYPSRSRSTTHTIAASSLGDTVDMDDEWVRDVVMYDPTNSGGIPEHNGKPSAPGTQYGEQVWSEFDQKVFVWREGFVPGVVRVKLEELAQVQAASHVHSGQAFAFR